MVSNYNTLVLHDSIIKKIQHWMYLSAVPALSLAIIKEDQVYTHGFKTELLENDENISGETVYYAASLTKPIFAYMILSCINEGILLLDKPLKDYYPLPNPDDLNAGHITARHILSHSTGWVNWRNNVSQKLVSEFIPGTKFKYSGEGYFFLQQIIEQLTGKSVSSLLREYVFQPLKMSSSSLACLPELDARRVKGHDARGVLIQEPYAKINKTLMQYARESGLSIESLMTKDSEKALQESLPDTPLLPNFLKPNSASSLLTTAYDYALFMQHLMKSSDRKTRDILNLMSAPQVSINDEVKWGLGLGLEINQDKILVWHWGDNPGYKNFFIADPVNQTAIIAFTAGDNGKNVYERLIREFTTIDHPAFLYYR